MRVIIKFKEPQDYLGILFSVMAVCGINPGRLDEHTTGIICSPSEFEKLQEQIAINLPQSEDGERVTFSISNKINS